ncbi:hypothetical protein BOS5A_230261 [Bosea sp. EC-HK365B]|nr:hypothetical protein BOSE21B_90338 [Bosea sp. 21B]CAD5295701.1 hypothetical protein BOSE46_80430 [Bosea sp. 46]VVT60984.1 hypothetical protein BOS5A_230261 [Bosea sp. EC-HK365B]VXC77229.1 hypothetical protein BOSE29B_80319 [Bosea sp. 29B]
MAPGRPHLPRRTNPGYPRLAAEATERSFKPRPGLTRRLQQRSTGPAFQRSHVSAGAWRNPAPMARKNHRFAAYIGRVTACLQGAEPD